MNQASDISGPVTCSLCSALVEPPLLPRHLDWHERLVDEVVTAVKVRLEDPPPGA